MVKIFDCVLGLGVQGIPWGRERKCWFREDRQGAAWRESLGRHTNLGLGPAADTWDTGGWGHCTSVTLLTMATQSSALQHTFQHKPWHSYVTLMTNRTILFYLLWILNSTWILVNFEGRINGWLKCLRLSVKNTLAFARYCTTFNNKHYASDGPWHYVDMQYLICTSWKTQWKVSMMLQRKT